MIPEKRLTVKKTVPLLLIGLLAFVLYLYFFVGIGEMVQILRQADPFFYSLAFAFAFLDAFFFSLAWRYFLLPLSVKTSLRRTYLFVWVGTFVDILVPAESVSGEVSRAYLMSKSSGGNAGEVAASVVGHRIVNMTIFLSSLILSSTLIILKPELHEPLILNLLVIAAVVTAISIFLLWLLSVRERTTWKIIDRILRLTAFLSRGRWSLAALRTRAQKTLKAFRQGINVLGRRPRNFILPIAFSVAAWVSTFLISILVFLSLGQTVPLSILFIVFSISNAVQVAPLGVPSASWKSS